MNLERTFSSYVVDESSLEAVRSAADLPAERAADGSPTLSLANRRLHSAVNPMGEAASILTACTSELEQIRRRAGQSAVNVLILGPGLGYIIKALEEWLQTCEISPNALAITCVEASAEVARHALQTRVWEPCAVEARWIVGHSTHVRHSVQSLSDPVVLACTADYRIHRALYDPLIPRAQGQVSAERPMRILVPTPLYGGSYPTALHCADAFRRLGHPVELLDLSPYYPMFRQAESVSANAMHRRTLQGLLTTYLAEVVAARAMDWNADLVWAVAQTPLTPIALQELHLQGVHTALWFVEDYRLFGYWRELAPRFDAVFTIQRGEFHEVLNRLGVQHVCYLPCAANKLVHQPLSLSPDDQRRFGSAVSFVGAGYANRQAAFEQLGLHDFKIWGNDWPDVGGATRWRQEKGRRVTTEETAKIFCATTINLNLHSSTSHGGVNPFGDFVNPRTFEIAACGGFQLVDERSELGDLFTGGEEVITFRRVDELPALIEYYIAHSEERRVIAARSRERVLREHTYVHRMESALEFLERRMPRLAARERGPNYASSLKRVAQDDPELLAFLNSFGDEELNLDKIVARIETGRKPLSRPEGLFLLMREFRDWGRSKGVIA